MLQLFRLKGLNIGSCGAAHASLLPTAAAERRTREYDLQVQLQRDVHQISCTAGVKNRAFEQAATQDQYSGCSGLEKCGQRHA